MKELLEKILANPEATIALVAVAISLLSLLLSVVTSFQNRKNSRLAVRPLAFILPPDYEERIAVILQNKGTGPLITKSISFCRGEDEVKRSLIDFMPNLEDGLYWTTFSKASKIILAPAEEKILLEFKGDPSDSQFVRQRDEIRRALSSIEVNLTYTSIFNEYCPFKLNYKLSWFARKK